MSRGLSGKTGGEGEGGQSMSHALPQLGDIALYVFSRRVASYQMRGRRACKCVTAQRHASTQRSQPSGRRGSDGVSLTVGAHAWSSCRIAQSASLCSGVSTFRGPGWLIATLSEQPR